MTTFRTIYAIECFTSDGDLKIRRYARNKKTAEKIVKQLSARYDYTEITLTHPSIRYLINPEWVEG